MQQCIRRLPITLVALTGLAGSGKDTVADVLVQEHGFTKIAFADALRREVSEAFDIAPGHLTQRETKEHPISALALGRCIDNTFIGCAIDQLRDETLLEKIMWRPRSARQIMQWWGTEYRRTQNPEYWTTQACNYIGRMQLEGVSRFVISDCRFQNEAALVRYLDGSIWQVVRPGTEPTPGAHISETEGSQFLPDVLLDNTHGIDHLRLQALAACNRLTLAEAA